MESNFYAFWLSCFTRIPLPKLWKCIQDVGGPEQFYKSKEFEWKEFTQAECDYIHQMKQRKDILNQWRELQEKNYRFVSYYNNKYPEKLKELTDAPFGIFYEGREDWAEPISKSPVVAMVGARACTQFGSQFAYGMAQELGKHGVVIVSGLATGIDGAGHRGCLDGGGFTLGVLGSGIDQVYPKEHYGLFMEMKKRGGILSEYPPGTKPLSLLFPRRNRIISALADFVLVIEAREKSGSLITVDFALEQGKDVGAVPGRPCDTVSSGCNRLLQQGAKCILSPEDVLEELSERFYIKNPDKNVPLVKTDLGLAPKEKMVYSCLRLEPKFIDEILCELELPIWEGIQILTELELKGVIRQEPHQYYYRIM